MSSCVCMVLFFRTSLRLFNSLDPVEKNAQYIGKDADLISGQAVALPVPGEAVSGLCHRIIYTLRVAYGTRKTCQDVRPHYCIEVSDKIWICDRLIRVTPVSPDSSSTRPCLIIYKNYIHIPKMGKYMSETNIQRNGNENGTKPYIYAGSTRAIGMR
ncbi:hypothetical protein L210DRAFT_561121 [Boletus edulis BED1]|uniref:Uncharacterized protein n=1 Tax=Boletus edulis BED1 TaxID=1328754 RepID=A0AAD4C8U2_BOLED|nr:hypothetical protein L210DRAFT_561121 [Boletus edulis BED1]